MRNFNRRAIPDSTVNPRGGTSRNTGLRSTPRYNLKKNVNYRCPLQNWFDADRHVARFFFLGGARRSRLRRRLRVLLYVCPGEERERCVRISSSGSGLPALMALGRGVHSSRTCAAYTKFGTCASWCSALNNMASWFILLCTLLFFLIRCA